MTPFRYLYTGFVKSVIYAPLTMQLREIHLSVHPMLKSVEEKLGLPARPKKPPNPYFRFASQIRTSLTNENPNLNPKEMMTLIAKKWKLLPDTEKDKFRKEYEEENLNFSVKLKNYDKTLSEDDKVKIYEMKAKIVEKKIKLSKSKKREELGKPKQPTSPFFKYMYEEQKDFKGKHTREEYWECKKQAAAKWRALSDAEREKYYNWDEKENYQKAMLNWEAKMIELGHYDVVRKTKKD